MKMTLKCHFKNFIDGARQILVMCPDNDYIYPSKRGFLDDHLALRGDANAIVRGVNSKIKTYGEQINYRKG